MQHPAQANGLKAAFQAQYPSSLKCRKREASRALIVSPPAFSITFTR
jgi:hypothetical protein